jgi:uncharacterized delta-60 repeat protein
MQKVGSILSVVSIALLISSLCYGDEWAMTYDGHDHYDSASSVQETSDGGYIVAGWTQYPGSDQHDFWVLRLASDGRTTWENSYDRTDYDYASCIQQTADDGYIVAGRSGVSSGGPYDFWVLKLNPDGHIDGDGSIAWQKTYDADSGDDYAYSIQQTADDGYIVAGKTSSALSSDDFWVLKLDDNGDIAWQKTYGGADKDIAYSIQQTTDDGYIVAGYTGSSGAGDYDFWVLKLNPDGDPSGDGSIAWQKTYGGTQRDIASSIQETTDGGYVVAGRTQSFSAGDYDFWVLKLNSNGTVAWEKTYGQFYADYASSIHQTTDSGYIVAGHTRSFGGGGGDFWVLKLHPDGWDPDGPGGDPPQDGIIAWEKTYGGTGWEAASSIQQTSGGGYNVAGDTWSFGVGDPVPHDLWVLKLGDNGQIPGCDIIGTSLAVVSSGSVQGQDTSAQVGSPFVTCSDTAVPPQGTLARMTVVCGPNQPPVFDPIGDKAVHEGILLEFVVTAWDPNDDVLTYSADNLPPGAGFDPGTQTFSWTPASGQAGTYPGVLFTVTDDGTPPWSDSEAITITVTVNNPPNVPANPSPADDATGVASISPVLSWTGGDPDPGDTVTYDLYFGPSDPPELKSSELADTSFTLGTLNCSTTYYWRVMARDDDGLETSGPLWSFTTAPCPVISKIRGTKEPRKKIRIVGSGFGDTQGDSVVHLGNRTYDSSKRRIKLWSDTMIKIKLPNYACTWFEGDVRRLKVWVTVGGVHSNVKNIRVYKPDICP